ncbi:MAG: hypothetical protein JW827_05740 [Spirochaetes bacterium]|nr:hypothetical protein [Spirochaetota bacterium]
MRVELKILDSILKKYGYKFMFDKIHADSELKKYKKDEPNFDSHQYLTIKTDDGIVVGRVYTQNSSKPIPLEKVKLNEDEITTVMAFFKFFKLKNYTKILNEISKIAQLNTDHLQTDIIRNNVFTSKRSQY